MKKIFTTAFVTLLLITSLSAQSELKSDCKNICTVSRLVEEGVLLGVRINNIHRSNEYCYVTEVLPKTSAERSGLTAGIIIQKVNDVKILSKTHLVEVIQSYKAGDMIQLTYQTGEKIINQKIRLGAMSTKVVEVTECCDEIKNADELVVEEGVSVFPNPASKEITIATKEALEGDSHILIYSLEGKEVYYNQGKRNESLRHKVDVSEYANGQYIVRIETPKANYLAKFQVQK